MDWTLVLWIWNQYKSLRLNNWFYEVVLKYLCVCLRNVAVLREGTYYIEHKLDAQKNISFEIWPVPLKHNLISGFVHYYRITFIAVICIKFICKLSRTWLGSRRLAWRTTAAIHRTRSYYTTWPTGSYLRSNFELTLWSTQDTKVINSELISILMG